MSRKQMQNFKFPSNCESDHAIHTSNNSKSATTHQIFTCVSPILADNQNFLNIQNMSGSVLCQKEILNSLTIPVSLLKLPSCIPANVGEKKPDKTAKTGRLVKSNHSIMASSLVVWRRRWSFSITVWEWINS